MNNTHHHLLSKSTRHRLSGVPRRDGGNLGREDEAGIKI
jgi:hypothetical protein